MSAGSVDRVSAVMHAILMLYHRGLGKKGRQWERGSMTFDHEREARRAGRVLVDLLELVVGRLATVHDRESEDRVSEIRVDGLLVAGGELVERLLSVSESPLVSGDSSVEVGERSKLDQLRRVGLREREAKSLDERTEEGESESIDSLRDRLGLLPVGGRQIGEELVRVRRR